MAARTARSRTIERPAAIEPSMPVPRAFALKPVGGLLAAAPTGIVGWAWLPASPEHMVNVIVRAGETELGQVRADDFGIDIVRKRVGAGVPGFRIRPAVAPTGPYPLSITLCTENGEVLGEALRVQTPEQLDFHILPGPDAKVEGVVDGFNEGRISGWAWNSAAPSHPLGVELYDGDRILGRGQADMYRPDLRDAGKREGACGFAIDLPASLLDGHTHSLQVRVAGHGIELQGSPLAFGRFHVGALAEEVAALRAQVASLMARIEPSLSPDGNFQAGLVRLLSDRMAALAELQRDMVTREMEALRALYRRQSSPGVTAEALS